MGWLGDALGGILPVAGGVIGSIIPGVGTALGGALGAAAGGAISGAGKQGKANQLRDAALGADQQDYNARAPVRNLALQRALAGIPQRPDLGQLFSNTGNPYERQALARPPVAMPPVPNAPTAPPVAGPGIPQNTLSTLARVNPGLANRLAGAGSASRFPVAMPPTGPTY